MLIGRSVRGSGSGCRIFAMLIGYGLQDRDPIVG